MAVEYY